MLAGDPAPSALLPEVAEGVSLPVLTPAGLPRHDAHYYDLIAAKSLFQPPGRAERSGADILALETEHLAYLAEDEAIPRTTWNPKWKYYHTQVGRDGEKVSICSHTRAHALEAGRLAEAWADAGKSFETLRTAKRTRIEANAPNREANLARSGDTQALERRCLFKLRDAIRAKEAERRGDALDTLHVHLR